jgi:drug/metabolite transporter (DMT)-like permease
MAVNQPVPKPLRMKTYAVLVLAVLAQASGNVFLSKGMKYVASFNSMQSAGLMSVPLQAAENPMIWIGVAMSITFYILFATALSWTDLSLVLPVISAEVVVNVAFADYFLGEPVSAARWAGTFLIAAGVILVLRSEKKRELSGCGEEAGRVASER